MFSSIYNFLKSFDLQAGQDNFEPMPLNLLPHALHLYDDIATVLRSTLSAALVSVKHIIYTSVKMDFKSISGYT